MPVFHNIRPILSISVSTCAQYQNCHLLKFWFLHCCLKACVEYDKSLIQFWTSHNQLWEKSCDICSLSLFWWVTKLLLILKTCFTHLGKNIHFDILQVFPTSLDTRLRFLWIGQIYKKPSKDEVPVRSLVLECLEVLFLIRVPGGSLRALSYWLKTKRWKPSYTGCIQEVICSLKRYETKNILQPWLRSTSFPHKEWSRTKITYSASKPPLVQAYFFFML